MLSSSGQVISRCVRSSRLFLSVALLFAVAAKATAQVDASTIAGKHIVGYQGWFRAPGDGSGDNDWNHWFGGSGTPSVSNLLVDFWPDLTGYPSSERFATGWTTGNGAADVLYSAYRQATTNYHFSLMQANNIDGVAVQRFITQIRDPKNKAAADKRVANVRAAAATYGRVFFIMYDVNGSGTNHTADDLIHDLETDWEFLTAATGSYKVTESDRYLKAHSLPLVIVYGLDNESPYTISTMDTLRTWFLTKGVTMGVGVSWSWASKSFKPAIERCGVIMPWSVGAFPTSTQGDYTQADGYRTGALRANLSWAHATANKTIIPVVWAGTSHANAGTTALNSHPRWGGCTYWRQVYNTINEEIAQSEPRILYTAMFDEVNEGTAIMPQITTKNGLPTAAKDALCYLNMDGYTLPKDWYLQIAGQATTYVRGGAAPTPTMPIQPSSGPVPPCCQ